MGLAAAVIGSAVIGAGASMTTGASQAHSIDQASQAQQASDAAAVAEQRRQFDVNQTNLKPWLQAGQTALGQQGDLIGLNGGDKQQAAIAALKGSPLFTSLMRNGQDAILANGSATGGLRGGNIQSSLANFGADTLASVIQQQLGNLGGISGNGMTTGTNLGTLGAGTSSNISNLLTQGGAAQAGGILGASGARAGGVTSGLTQLTSGLTTGFGLLNQGGGYSTGLPQYTGLPAGSELDGLF